MKLNQTDTDALKSVIAMKLSKKNIIYFEVRATTSRCESLNRAIAQGCPRNQSFPRNSRARVCSTIGRHNNQWVPFTRMKCRAIKCELPEDSVGGKVVDGYHRKRASDAKYQYHLYSAWTRSDNTIRELSGPCASS